MQNPTTITLCVTVPVLNTILTGMASLPYKDVASAIEDISAQAQRQLNPPAETPTDTAG